MARISKMGVPDPELRDHETPSQAAAVYARAVAFERVKRELMNKIKSKHGQRAAEPRRSVTDRIRGETPLVSHFDLAGGFVHTHAALGHTKGRAPISVHAPGGNAGLMSISTMSERAKGRNKLCRLITCLRRGTQGLYSYPAAPTLYRTPLSGDADAYATWAKAANSVSACTLCGESPISPLHVLCHCKHGPVAAARRVVYASAPNFLRRFVLLLKTAQIKSQGHVEGGGVTPDAAKTEADEILRAATAADRDGADWEFTMARMLLMSTWSEESLSDTPDDTSCELSSAVARVMDTTHASNRHLRPAANEWTTFAARATERIVSEWSTAVDAKAGLDHEQSRLDDLAFAAQRPRKPKTGKRRKQRDDIDEDGNMSVSTSSGKSAAINFGDNGDGDWQAEDRAPRRRPGGAAAKQSRRAKAVSPPQRERAPRAAAAAPPAREAPKRAAAAVVRNALAGARPLSRSDYRVLKMFGIDKTRADELITLLRRVILIPDSRSALKTLGVNQLVDDGSIQSLAGDIDDTALTAATRLLMRLLPGADARQKTVILDAAHSAYMTGAEDPVQMRHLFLDALAGKHVAPATEVIIVPTNPGGHWIVNVVNNVTNEVCSLEPLNYDRSANNRPKLAELEKMLAAERVRMHVPARAAAYVEIPKPANLSTQNDSTSCGAFCFAYIYFQFFYGRLPMRADINGGNHLALRLAMLDVCVEGRVKRGVITA